ncbi:MAG: kinase/pyrophosphorylase [Bdellovibrionaceae bacterium]|nr:kinase/pyrophosphorylase [Bdellovibrionales bacterium]MCB9085792.1 kinase/pyrophosphorylase [Pseudobdellovibrionaceae bacterium]
MSRVQGTIYIISDGTGETAATMVRAALVHFHDKEINIVRCKNVRTEEQIENLMGEVFDKKGLVAHTVVSNSMRKKILESASEKGIPAIDLLGPMMNLLDDYFGGTQGQDAKVGLLRTVDERYFKRIEAIEYTVKHDDGKLLTDLDQADIVLVGISRTSKTPLSIFMSHKGWKVANIPLVVGTPLPEELFKIDQRKIVGLMIDHDSLLRIRRKRLEKFGQDPGGEYASLKYIEKEMEYAQELFKKNRKWPVLNVTDRAMEETAAEIIRIVASRMDLPYDQML